MLVKNGLKNSYFNILTGYFNLVKILELTLNNGFDKRTQIQVGLETGGTLLNQKFTPSFFDDSESYSKLTSLIRSWFHLEGHHIQFNVVSAATLRDARKNPEKYRDLIVRVAGYSDYFNDLGEDLQNEIIKRTEQAT